MKLLLRWAISAFSLFVAVWAVPGIQVDSDGWVVYAVTAVVLGFVNAIIRPILKLLTCPLILLTLGLFTLVINGFALWLAAALANGLFGAGFYVNGFWSAFFGGLIVSIVSIVLNAVVKDDEDD